MAPYDDTLAIFTMTLTLLRQQQQGGAVPLRTVIAPHFSDEYTETAQSNMLYA